MLTGEDLQEAAEAEAVATVAMPTVDTSPEAVRDTVFAWMVAPAVVYLAGCRELYRILSR